MKRYNGQVSAMVDGFIQLDGVPVSSDKYTKWSKSNNDRNSKQSSS